MDLNSSRGSKPTKLLCPRGSETKSITCPGGQMEILI